MKSMLWFTLPCQQEVGLQLFLKFILQFFLDSKANNASFDHSRLTKAVQFEPQHYIAGLTPVPAVSTVHMKLEHAIKFHKEIAMFNFDVLYYNDVQNRYTCCEQ